MPDVNPRDITRAVKLSRRLDHEIKRAGRTVDPEALKLVQAAADRLHAFLLAMQESARS